MNLFSIINWIFPVQYNLIRQDRDRFDGGLTVHVTEQLNYKRLDLTSEDMEIDPNMETMWFELYPAKSRQLLIGIFYRHPSYSHYSYSLITLNRY